MLRRKYESRLSEWEQEKSEARRELHEKIKKERDRLMEELHHELEQERNRESIINQRLLDQNKKINERLALKQGAAFSARLLSRLASPELEAQIADLVIDEMSGLGPELKQTLISSRGEYGSGINVYSAYTLAAELRERIENTLGNIIGTAIQYHYHKDPTLIAGLRIAIGSRLLEATLKDELKYFSGDYHDAN